MDDKATKVKRRRRTNAQVDQLECQIIDVLKADHPQSVRHVFYRMTDPRRPEPVEKSDRGYRHVQNRMKEMRLRGTLPYRWVTDTSRNGYYVNTYGPVAEFLRDTKELYRADIWRHLDVYCEVWCESRSVASVILNDCQDLAVSLYPAGGFTSLSLPFEAARFIRGAVGDTVKRVVILYIGDYDPAGVLIDQDIERKLRQHLPDVELEFRRLGINEAQVVEYDLPKKERKASDRRSRHLTYTVEAEAMTAGIMRRLLRQEVEQLLPPRALAVAKVAEEDERGILDLLICHAEEYANARPA
jgi:hypothetical protein